MALTLKQLQKNLQRERKKLSKARRIEENITAEINKKTKIKSEERKIQSELFRLKHRKVISRSKKLKALSGRFGKSLLKTGSKLGKKIGPAIIKQGKLIREQQLRDNAREAALLKRNNKIPRNKPKKTSKKRTKKRTSKKKRR